MHVMCVSGCVCLSGYMRIGNQSGGCMCVRACKHVHLLGLRAACFTGETVDVCVAVVCVRHGVGACVHASMCSYLACVLPVSQAKLWMCVWLLCACVMVINQVCMMYACKHVHLLVCGGQLKLNVCDCESGDKLKPSEGGGEVS